MSKAEREGDERFARVNDFLNELTIRRGVMLVRSNEAYGTDGNAL